MRDIEQIKEAISNLYELNTEIHVDVNSKKPKIKVNDAPARITGVYKNLFTIETMEKGIKKVYTISYTDVFIGKVIIKEV